MKDNYDPLIVFFSTKSRNTYKFVNKLPFKNYELTKDNLNDIINSSFVLITPTYGGGYIKGAVPPTVIKFLNQKENRDKLIGVISTGNRNFGNGFCQAGKIISTKCEVPNLLDVELFGTKEDVNIATETISNLFNEEEDDS